MGPGTLTLEKLIVMSVDREGVPIVRPWKARASSDPVSKIRAVLMPDTEDTGSNGFPERTVKTGPLKGPRFNHLARVTHLNDLKSNIQVSVFGATPSTSDAMPVIGTSSIATELPRRSTTRTLLAYTDLFLSRGVQPRLSRG
jgi:hypothetical protein